MDKTADALKARFKLAFPDFCPGRDQVYGEDYGLQISKLWLDITDLEVTIRRSGYISVPIGTYNIFVGQITQLKEGWEKSRTK